MINRKLISTLVLALMASNVLATDKEEKGDKAGNGGGAHVCRDKNGRISKIEMYDLYEGKERFALGKNPIDAKDENEYLTKALDVIRNQSPSLSAKIEAAKKIYSPATGRYNPPRTFTPSSPIE